MLKPKNRQGITVVEILDTIIVSSKKYRNDKNYQKPYEATNKNPRRN